MELTYNDLQQKDVVNVVDGKCLGRIKNIKFKFPDGVIKGIFVPGKKVKWYLKLFDKGNLYIDQGNIIKIGGDVILVNIKCGDTCEQSTGIKEKKSVSPCQPICPPFCGSTDNGVNSENQGGGGVQIDNGINNDINIDLGDY